MPDSVQECPCTSGLPLASCCGPYLSGISFPPTAQALMRSRYTAYALGDLKYLQETLDPARRSEFDLDMVRQLSERAIWQGLEILDVKDGGETDDTGEVEFVARFTLDGTPRELKERSGFRRVGGRWVYTTGKVRLGTPVTRTAPRIGRNDPCPCGSGRKYKKCCG